MDNKNKIFDIIENTDFSNNESTNNDESNATNVEQTETTNSKNVTFFEKFEKTKKDMLKEKRASQEKAERSLRSKSKALGFENKLRDDDFIRNSWIAFIAFGFLFLIYACVSLGFLAPYFNGDASGNFKWIFTQLYTGMNKTIVVCSSIIIVIIPLPYLYLLGTWFVGINGSHKSKTFFIVNMCVMLLSVFLMLLIIPMSSFIFHKTLWYEPLGNPPNPPSGDDDGADKPTKIINGISHLINSIIL